MSHYLSQPRIEDPIWLEPNDISFLQTRISEAETVMQRIENRIEELRAQISELTRHKDVKLVEIATFRNILAPVRRIPLEILSEIFELAYLFEDSFHKNNLVRFMFALTGVCAAWRKAAHATPRLWCRLDISLERHHLGSDFIWLTGWITRCQSLPLDLHLDLYVGHSDELRDVLKQRGKELLEYVLANFGHKIRVLYMVGHPSSFLPILQLPPSSPLISLERVYLFPLNDHEDSMEQIVDCSPPKVEVFLGSPKLREVELYSASFLELLVLPAEQLTLLKLDPSKDLAVCWDLLSQCRNLVSLEIIGSSPLVNHHLIVSMPALKSLRVPDYCIEAGDLSRCLRFLTAPLLEILHIGYYIEDLDTLIHDLTAFQQRSAARLSSLTIAYRSIFSEPIIEKVVPIFSLFHTIHSLEFSTRFDANPLIRAMTCSEGYHVLPNLKHLKLYCTSPEGYVDASELKSMVLSRWWPERLGVGSGLVPDRNGLCRLQKVTIRNFDVRGSVEDITDLSALSGFILDYKLTKHHSQV